jgi:hypothetical protein
MESFFDNIVVQKPIRYPNTKCAEMGIRLHRFEAIKVAGPGSSRKKITDVLWSLEEVIQYLALSETEKPIFERLIRSLQDQNHLLKIPESIDGVDGYISRTAETLRIIGHTYEYWHRGRPGVDAIRWEIVPKYIPRRDIPSEEFVQKLIQQISDKTGMDESISSLGQAIQEVVSGIDTHFKDVDKIAKPKFSDFQFRATRQGLLDALGLGGSGTILVAGVGSGKTLAFMLPPLILAKRDIIEGSRSYGAHLFLYPRKALALDQFSKSLKPFAKAVGIPINQVHSEMGKHYKSLPTGTVYKGIRAVHGGHTPPRLIISSLETLKNRIAHPTIVNKLFSRIKTVTFDEVHLQSGVQGAQAAMLMRRLGRLCPEDTAWVGASATIAKPEDHLGRLMGIDSNSIRLIEPKNDEMQIDGVVHHAFMRPSGLIAQAGVLTNATSLLVHHRRDNLSIRPGPKQSKKAPKVITFADNLEILGSWNDDFRENERTDVYQTGPGQVRYHPNNENMEMWDARMRELPYARRFQNTLERRIEAHGGTRPESQGGGIALSPVFVEWRGKDVCKRCKNGERFDLGYADADTMFELSKLVHRVDTLESRNRDSFLPFMINNDEIFLQPGIVGTQEKCPYLQAAACTSFSSHPVEEVKRIGDSSGGVVKFDFASRATSNIQSSKSEDFSEFADDLSQAVFRAPNHILHSVNGSKGDDFVDVVMASPSLEVGVDLPNLTESIMTRAVRNLASYRQKAGRVGRESMSEALNLTLATDSANDLHYYRQPRKLIDRGRLEPVPLKEKNEAVAKSTAYLAIWDVLVKRGKLPEALLEHSSNSAHNMIKDSYDYISNSSNINTIKTHISKVLNDERYVIETDWFNDAISQIKDELALLLKPISGYQFEPALAEPKTVIAAIRHIRHNGYTTNPARPVGNANQLVEDYESAMNDCNYRKRQIGFLSLDHSDLFLRIHEYLRDAPSASILDGLIDDISSLRRDFSDDPSNKSKLRNFGRQLENLLYALNDLNDSGIDMLAFRAVEQYQKLITAEEGSWKSYYFSATIRSLDVFKQVQRDSWFVSPDTLYIHPHMKMVKLIQPVQLQERHKDKNLRTDQSLIPLSEALHSFLPGMWTRRLPQSTFKVLAGETIPVGGRTLQASIERMEQGGFKYEVVKKSLPPPPGLIGQIQVVSPLEIPIRPLINKRTIKTALLGPQVLDSDEGQPRGETSNPRIPKSFSQRWLHIELDDGVQINPYIDLDDGEKLIESLHAGGPPRDIAIENIVHPFSETAFSSVKWHKKITVTEYVYGLSRTLRTENGFGTEIFYANERGAHTTFGQKINTEGIAFTLDETSFEGVKRNGIEKIIEGSSEWIPSMIRAFRSHIRDIHLISTGKPLSNFVIDDIIAIVIAIWRRANCPNLNLEQLKMTAQQLVDDSDLLLELVTNRVDAKMKTPDDETRMTEDDVIVRTNRIDEMRGAIQYNLSLYLSNPVGFNEFLPIWLHRTILMSFGVSAVGATQRIAGGNSQEIGFGLTDDSWKGDSTTVVVYDRAECGNGNVSVARTFMHIPNIVRSAKGSRGRFLPTIDFLSTLEEMLLPCPQQHCDILGLEYLRTKGSDSVLHRSMVDYTEFGKEIHNVGESVWSALNLQGPTDGWKLPLFHYMRRELAAEINQEQDDVTRSTRVCWNGCPECIERIDIVQGGYIGMDYLDKSVMDFWFRHLRGGSNEYIDLEPDSMIDGGSGLQLGDLHSLALDTTRGRIRSLMLPWTIGVDLDRSNLDEGIRLIIRQSDLVGLRQSEPNEGIAMGMPSSSFKRLLWFDLLMTAYLDMRGAIPDESRKKIKLVYYDARDISFDDVGLAPQLLEALRAQVKADNAGPLETFSDMLIWLAKRGFEIQMCIDKRVRTNPRNSPVREFIRKLKSTHAEGRIKLFEREVIDDNEWKRSMHKKTMITPIFVLKGTANMTRSGAGLNEEDVDHMMFGTPQYESMTSSCEDTISQATILN